MSRFPIANKSFGQHFLSSPSVIGKITGSLPPGVDAIVEVGPGPAVLTPRLAAHGLPLYVVEMDPRFVELLAPIVGNEKVFNQDALEFDWRKFLGTRPHRNVWLVSNLPYNVSVPLTLSFLRVPEISHMTLMYQKEVAEKILPRDPRNSMGSLHALTMSQFEISLLAHVPPGAFVPPPKVDSQVLHFRRRTVPLVPLDRIDQFESFLRTAFSNRRKQLGGILKKEWGDAGAEKSLAMAGAGPLVRAEALTLNQVLQIYDALTAHSP